jgi:hypothetical protein
MFEYDEELSEDGSTLWINYAKQDDIDHLVIPNTVTELYIIGDFVQTMHVPEGVQGVTIIKCGLRELTLPQSIRRVYLDNNLLTRLDLPKEIEIVNASFNYIEQVNFIDGNPTSLQQFIMKENRLRRLDFLMPKSIHRIDINKNFYLEYVHPSVQVADSILNAD